MSSSALTIRPIQHERWVEPNRDVDTTGMYNPRVHNTKGMTFVSLTNFPDDSDAKVRQAADEIGGDFRWNLDYNSGDPLGVGRCPRYLQS